MKTLHTLISNQADLARRIGLSKASVRGWVQRNAIPPKHIARVADALGLPLSELMEFSRTGGPYPKFLRKTVEDLDDMLRVYRGEPYTGRLPKNSITIALARWGDRFPLFYDTMKALERGEITNKQAAECLGVVEDTLKGLRVRYGVRNKPKVRPPKPLKKKVLRAPIAEKAVLDVISGRKTALKAAADADIPLRTFHRYIQDVLRPRKLQEITHWSRNFRTALAWEIENRGFKSTEGESAPEKWRKWAEDQQLVLPRHPKWPKTPENLRELSLNQLLIVWLSGEMSLMQIAEMRGEDETHLERLFLLELRRMGMESDYNSSVNHRLAAAEVVAAHESLFRSAK